MVSLRQGFGHLFNHVMGGRMVMSGRMSPLLAQLTQRVEARPTLQSPPIMIVSLPRGGSSWVGSILGASASALYLREPITQSYLRLVRDSPAEFELARCADQETYLALAAKAFEGVADFDASIALYPKQWSYWSRASKRVVIKEVNPLALTCLIERFAPRIVYLLRHPVAVANSYYARGWTGDKFRSRFSEAALSDLEQRFAIPYEADFWEQMGAYQAVSQTLALDTLHALSPTSEFMIVRYEDICRSPVAVFSQLFDFCELTMSDEVKQRIKTSTCSTTAYKPGRYDNSRDSARMVDRWRSSVEREHVALVKKGYFANKPRYYQLEDEWA